MAHHPPPPGLARRLRSLRKLAGLSLRQTSLLVSGAVTLAASIERNPRANPTVGTVRRFASAFGASLDWLVNGEGDPPTREQVAAAIERTRARGAARAETLILLAFIVPGATAGLVVACGGLL